MLSNKLPQIERLIQEHFNVLMIKLLGDSAVSSRVYKSLMSNASITQRTAWKTDAVSCAYFVGIASVQNNDLLKSDLSRVLKSVDNLTATEKAAIEAAKARVGSQVRGLASAVAGAAASAVHDVDTREANQNLIALRTVLGQGIADRKNAVQISQMLADKIQDVKKDWLRVAATELHNAMDQGRMAAILDRASTEDPMVFKRPRPDSCEHCKRLYLENGVPRVYKLSELLANGPGSGSRMGLRPVIGAAHPWCNCVLQHLPAGMSLASDGSMRYVGERG